MSRYVEREDEFDIIPVDPVKRPLVDDVVVDILAIDPVTDPNSMLGVTGPTPSVVDELTTLPTTVLSDQETNAAYQMRRQQWMREEAEKRNQTKREIEPAAVEIEMKQETQTSPTAPTPAPTLPIETNSLKRPFEESAQTNGESEEEKNKRVKL